jgi:hypothetical protein
MYVASVETDLRQKQERWNNALVPALNSYPIINSRLAGLYPVCLDLLILRCQPLPDEIERQADAGVEQEKYLQRSYGIHIGDAFTHPGNEVTQRSQHFSHEQQSGKPHPCADERTELSFAVLHFHVASTTDEMLDMR